MPYKVEYEDNTPNEFFNEFETEAEAEQWIDDSIGEIMWDLSHNQFHGTDNGEVVELWVSGGDFSARWIRAWKGEGK